jgi:hypothetical protein
MLRRVPEKKCGGYAQMGMNGKRRYIAETEAAAVLFAISLRRLIIEIY